MSISHVIVLTLTLPYITSVASIIYSTFIRQCVSYRTKSQHDRSNEIIANWLRHPAIVSELGETCIDAIRTFQATMRRKEMYLANYLRKQVPMSMDAMTTSPVESMNNLIKNNMKISANMNLSTSLPLMLRLHTKRIAKHFLTSKAQLQKTTLASTSTTRTSITKHCQHILDKLFNDCHPLKCVQETEYEWICWDFDSYGTDFHLVRGDTNDFHIDDDVGTPSAQLQSEQFLDTMTACGFVVPYFAEVFRVCLQKVGEDMFLHCSCLLHNRCGMPCKHVFKILGQMEVSMVNVQFWKTYSAYYDSPCQLGEAIRTAQYSQLKREGLGVPVTRDMLNTASFCHGFWKNDNAYPLLYDGTTDADYAEATFVQSSGVAITQQEMKQFREIGIDRITTSDMSHVHERTLDSNILVVLSPEVQRLHRDLNTIELAGQDSAVAVPDKRKLEARKNIIDNLDFMLANRHLTDVVIEDLERTILLKKQSLVHSISSSIGMKPVGDSLVWAGDSPVKRPPRKVPRKLGASG